MELWWRVRGWVRLRLTSADCAGRLRELAKQIRLVDIRFSNDLTVEFSICKRDRDKVRVRDGDSLAELKTGGFPKFLEVLGRWKSVAAAVVLLGALTVFLQGRVLFFQVEGNDAVPARLILERAGECGLEFGASARSLRSEEVKNHLLWAIPELRWAGVNVSGCTAVLTVAERDPAGEPEEVVTGDIVAAVDAVVTEVFPAAGTLLAAPGQAVRAGDVLISGETDLGLLIRYDRAEGEVYGLTRRDFEVVLPSRTTLRQENGRVVRKFSLRIGKKYVNFSNDSGILHGTCGRMRTVKYMTLPGGFQLPVALVTDTYRLCDTEPISREMDEALLLEGSRRTARESMIAGTILREETAVVNGRLHVTLECREMIGIFRPGTITEGDTNDRENRERGAG